MASTLGAHNPLRYRGYIYDTETGLYYMQTKQNPLYLVSLRIICRKTAILGLILKVLVI